MGSSGRAGAPHRTRLTARGRPRRSRARHSARSTARCRRCPGVALEEGGGTRDEDAKLPRRGEAAVTDEGEGVVGAAGHRVDARQINQVASQEIGDAVDRLRPAVVGEGEAEAVGAAAAGQDFPPSATREDVVAGKPEALSLGVMSVKLTGAYPFW